MVSQQQLARVIRRLAAGVLVAGALASCGGGTYQVSSFVPERILTFGDENSLIATDGSKYTVNGINSSTNLQDCSVNPIWMQTLAASYTMVYPECNTDQVASPGAHSYAAVDATVADVVAQIEAFAGSDSFNRNDLVTVWVGLHDILEVYSEVSSGDETPALSEIRSRALALAGAVNGIIANGAKVLLLTVPDVGGTPFGVAENDRGDFDRSTLLTHLTDEFNRALRSNITNDGSQIGTVLVDDSVSAYLRSPSSYGYTSTTVAACPDTAPLPGCSTENTLTVLDGNTVSASSFLWADSTHLNYVAHAAIGNLAVSRAHSNPF